jgi:predicted mannosyl-3-phosphoglycerate phosphatase (HAD superfamily)
VHTDEYEISLARELQACEKMIETIRKSLLRLERKYKVTTEDLVRRLEGGATTGYGNDLISWMKEHEALKKWEASRDQYAELLRRMKI